MGTNGGCGCLASMSFDDRMRVRNNIRELLSENKKLKAAIWDLIAGAPAYDIPLVAEMIKELGCEESTWGNPMDGYEVDCAHGYEWECEQCPCFGREDDDR